MFDDPKTRLHVLVVDHDLDIRMRVKQALLSVYHFIMISHVNSLHEARELMNGEDRIDIIVVSYRFDDSEILDLISDAKDTLQGCDAAFLLLVSEHNKGNGRMANCMIEGADCFLSEPFTVEELVHTTAIARQINHQKRIAREVIVIKLLVRDLARHIDILAFLNSTQRTCKKTIHKLQEMAAVRDKLHPESISYYYDALINVFSMQPFPDKRRREGIFFTSPSKRIREKLEEALLARAEKDKSLPD